MATEEKEILIESSIEMTEVKPSLTKGLTFFEDENIKLLIQKFLDKKVDDIKITNAPNKASELKEALDKGDIISLKALINKGAPIDTWARLDNGLRTTTLTFAAQFENLDIFCLILARAINEKVDFKCLYIKTAMQKACINNLQKFAKILIKLELDYEHIYEKYIDDDDDDDNHYNNAQSFEYYDPKAGYLHLCAFYGSREVLKLLLEMKKPGNEITRQDSSGNTPIHIASDRGHIKCVKALVSKGADINQTNKFDRTPLFNAIYSASDEFIYELLRVGANANAKDRFGMTPFLIAAENGRDTIFPTLINYGAEIDSKNAKNQTPLMMACKAGSAATIRDLLIRGASVDDKDKSGADAFAIARKVKQDEALSLIIRMRRESNNFIYLDWHKVLDKELYKSILTMLDCLIEPELDKNQVKLDFTVLEMDNQYSTPDDYWYYEKRKSSLIQRFAATDNDEIAYHGVTRILVNQKFKKYGNLLLGIKTLLFISFLVALLYALVQAAQEHRTPHTLYRGDISVWDIFRYLCEIYVVMFWLSNIVTESAEVIQIIFYARKDIVDRKEEKEQRLEEEANKKKQELEKKNLEERPESHHSNEPLLSSEIFPDSPSKIDVINKPETVSISGKSDKSNHSDKSEQSAKSDKSEQSAKSEKSQVSAKPSRSQLSDKISVSEHPDLSGDIVEKIEGEVGGDTDDISISEKSDFGEENDSNYWDRVFGNKDSDASEYSGDDDSDSDDDYDPFQFYLESVSEGGDEDKRRRDEEKRKRVKEKTENRIKRLKEKIKDIKESILYENIFTRVMIDYFHDWYNWLDVIGLLLIFILIIFRIIILVNPEVRYLEFQWVFATFAFAINAFRLTKLLNVFNVIGTYLRIIILILFKDVPKFLLLLFLTFIFFSTTLYLSYRVPIIIGETNGTNGTGRVNYYITLFDLPNLNEDGFDKYYYTLIYPLRVLLEGNALEFNYLFNTLNIVAAGVYIIFLFLIIVVYLNVFIAQLSDTYATVKENAEKIVAKYRLDFIVQTQTTSLLALFIDFRKKYFKRNFILEDGEWVDYFNASISLLDDDDFTTQQPSESLLTLVNKVQQQQLRSTRNQEIRFKEQLDDTKEIKKTLKALDEQNKQILEKLGQLMPN